MAKKRRRYEREFKLDAVRLVVEKGRTVTDVARSLGVARPLLQTWKQKFLEDGSVAFPGPGNLTPEKEELRQLRRENVRLREDRDILEKAAVDSIGQRNTRLEMTNGNAKVLDHCRIRRALATLEAG